MMSERFVDAPTPEQRDMATRGAPAVRELVARGIAGGLVAADLVIFLTLVAREHSPPPVSAAFTAVAGGVRATMLLLEDFAANAKGELGRRGRALRHTDGADAACVVFGSGATFVGHTADVGVSLEQRLDLPAGHPAFDMLQQLAHGTAPAARADVLAYAHAHGLAPGEVAAVVCGRPNADATGVVPTPAAAGPVVAAEINVGRRATMSAEMRESHPAVSAAFAAPPKAAHFWFGIMAFGLFFVLELPLVEPAAPAAAPRGGVGRA